MTSRTTAAAKVLYDLFKKGVREQPITADQVPVVEELIQEGFMANEFWMKIDKNDNKYKVKMIHC